MDAGEKHCVTHGHPPPPGGPCRGTACHRIDPAGALFLSPACTHASAGWGEAPLVLTWINLATRRDTGAGPKLAWALFGLIPLVPFLYVLTGGDLW